MTRISPIAVDNDRSRAVEWQRTFDAALSACDRHLSVAELITRAAFIANSVHGTFPGTERFGALGEVAG